MKGSNVRDDWVPGFSDYIRALNCNLHIIKSEDDPKQFVYDLRQVKAIRDKIMHFKNHKLEVATGSDIALLKSVLDKVKMLSKD